MHKPMDTQAQSLKGKVVHFMSHEFKTPENKDRNRKEILKEWEGLKQIPITEFSQNTWDDLNVAMEQLI